MRSKASIKAHPLHPILVSFPIGLWVASLIFDLIAVYSSNNLLWAAGFFCVLAGCIGAALAAIPGVIDLLSVVPPRSSAKQRGYIHGALNTVALLLFIAVAWQRGGPWPEPEPISLYFSVAGVLLIGISGWPQMCNIAIAEVYAHTVDKIHLIDAVKSNACRKYRFQLYFYLVHSFCLRDIGLDNLIFVIPE